MTSRVPAVLRDAFGEVYANLEATLDEFEADRDHAHLFVSYPLKLALSVLVNRLKTVSGYRVRQRHWPEVERALWNDHFWSPFSAVISCGGAPLERVRRQLEVLASLCRRVAAGQLEIPSALARSPFPAGPTLAALCRPAAGTAASWSGGSRRWRGTR